MPEPDPYGPKPVREQGEVAFERLGWALQRPDVQRLALEARVRVVETEADTADEIRLIPEFQALLETCLADPSVRALATRGGIEAALLILVGADDIDTHRIKLKQQAIDEPFLFVLSDEQAVEWMREQLAVGQVWLRHDVIGRGHERLANDLAVRARRRAGIPDRPSGARSGPRPDRAELLRVVRGAALTDEQVWEHACRLGIQAGAFVDASSEDTTHANARWVEGVRSDAKRFEG